jgi:hypothetical protein
MTPVFTIAAQATAAALAWPLTVKCFVSTEMSDCRPTAFAKAPPS